MMSSKIPVVIQLIQGKPAELKNSAAVALLAYLPQQGLETSLIQVDSEGIFYHHKKEKEVVVCRREKKTGWDLALAGKLARYLKLEKASVLHLHEPLLSLAVLWRLQAAGIKCVYSMRGLSHKTMSFLWYKTNRAIIFDSHYTRQKFLLGHHLPNKKAQVTYDGLNLALLKEILPEKITQLKDKLKIDPSALVMGSLGGFYLNQDQTTLLKTFRKMIKKNVNAILVFSGDGPVKNDIEKMSVEFGVHERVRFVEEDDECLSLLDVLIVSANETDYAPFILKAMALRKVVVATKIGIQAEYVDEKSGFLVPCGFPERIESAVMRLYASRGLLKTMGDLARERLVQYFSMDKMAQEQAALYQKIL